jgi:hypothetical protein
MNIVRTNVEPIEEELGYLASPQKIKMRIQRLWLLKRRYDHTLNEHM